MHPTVVLSLPLCNLSHTLQGAHISEHPSCVILEISAFIKELAYVQHQWGGWAEINHVYHIPPSPGCQEVFGQPLGLLHPAIHHRGDQLPPRGVLIHQFLNLPFHPFGWVPHQVWPLVPGAVSNHSVATGIWHHGYIPFCPWQLIQHCDW